MEGLVLRNRKDLSLRKYYTNEQCMLVINTGNSHRSSALLESDNSLTLGFAGVFCWAGVRLLRILTVLPDFEYKN